jgi:mannose-6-phosphate isomerase-like protein (cupin superfamily)
MTTPRTHGRRLCWLAALCVLPAVGCQAPAPRHAAAAPSQPNQIVFTLSDGTEYQPLLTGPPQTCGMRSGHVVLARGEECGWHSTGRHEEQLVILAGQGQVLSENGEPVPVRAGQVIYIPPDQRHNVRGQGDQPMRYVYVVSPVCPQQPSHPAPHEHSH